MRARWFVAGGLTVAGLVTLQVVTLIGEALTLAGAEDVDFITEEI